jgi:hypothetical protein
MKSRFDDYMKYGTYIPFRLSKQGMEVDLFGTIKTSQIIEKHEGVQGLSHHGGVFFHELPKSAPNHEC